MILALTLLSGVAWMVVYVVAIRIGFHQKTYAIPAAALALNIAWESIYATRGLPLTCRCRHSSTWLGLQPTC